MANYILLIIGVVCGLILSSIFFIFFRGFDGAIIVSNSDGDRIMWTVRYDRNPEEITKHKSVRFRVYVDN